MSAQQETSRRRHRPRPRSGAPALAVFAVPGVLAVVHGRRAVRLGRPDGRVPAVLGAVIGLGFIGLNALSYVVTVLLG